MQRGVLLLNLGGPETLRDVRPFLYNLFSDPEIIRIKSDVLRRLVAWLIAWSRNGKSQNLYRQIGGGSPLRRITEAQAAALSARLDSAGVSSRVYVGMRCWKPSIDEAVERILRDRITRLVLLPLFPQYSLTTTGSCLKHFEKLDRKLGLSAKMNIAVVRSWFDEPLYIESMGDLIQDGLQHFHRGDNQEVQLLYSAHSIPVRYVKEGDPYLEQTRRSVALINAHLNDKHPWILAFQSKVGPVRWLEPATKDVLMDLGRKGCARILTVPISFVSDHIETLQEIDIAYKEIALQFGVKEFLRSESLNLHPKFIDALVSVVLKAG
jgi:ferrochelatase